MTNEQKVEAYRMRLEGASLQECADKFGVTREYIRQSIPPTGTRARRRNSFKRCIYPNLRKWLRESRHNYCSFAQLCACEQSTVFNVLTGKHSASKRTIDKILDATGMTYEEAFQTADELLCSENKKEA